MTSNLIRSALACLVLLLLPAAAQAGGDIIFGIGGHGLASVGVSISRVAPDGTMISILQGQESESTDAKGQINFKGLAPGNYMLAIDGPSLVAAMDKLAPPAPQKKSEGSSFSLGVGGMFGGGSSHSSSGHEGMNGHPESGHGDSHSSGGGVGVGLNIPVGGGDKGGEPDKFRSSEIDDDFAITITLPQGHGFSIETPYCRNGAQQGMRIQVTVPPGPANSDYSGWYLGFGIGYGKP